MRCRVRVFIIFGLVIYELGLESAFSPFFWFFMGLLGATVRCRQQGMVS